MVTRSQRCDPGPAETDKEFRKRIHEQEEEARKRRKRDQAQQQGEEARKRRKRPSTGAVEGGAAAAEDAAEVRTMAVPRHCHAHLNTPDNPESSYISPS